MDTMNHQWLATAFLPQSVIDEAMAAREGAMQEQTEHNSSDELGGYGPTPPPLRRENISEEDFYELFWELERELHGGLPQPSTRRPWRTAGRTCT